MGSSSLTQPAVVHGPVGPPLGRRPAAARRYRAWTSFSRSRAWVGAQFFCDGFCDGEAAGCFATQGFFAAQGFVAAPGAAALEAQGFFAAHGLV